MDLHSQPGITHNHHCGGLAQDLGQHPAFTAVRWPHIKQECQRPTEIYYLGIPEKGPFKPENYRY